MADAQHQLQALSDEYQKLQQGLFSYGGLYSCLFVTFHHRSTEQHQLKAKA
jgi:hypothetical protein